MVKICQPIWFTFASRKEFLDNAVLVGVGRVCLTGVLFCVHFLMFYGLVIIKCLAMFSRIFMLIMIVDTVP